MGTLVRHLTLWELRRTLRSGTFRFLAAAYVLVPAVALFLVARGQGKTPTPGRAPMAALLWAQEAMLFLIVALWTVWAVRQVVAEPVSDDWLLMVRWRNFVASKYLTAVGLGFLLVALGAPLTLLMAAYPDLSLSNAAAALLVLLVTVAIPVTVATFICAAADALIVNLATATLALVATGGLLYALGAPFTLYALVDAAGVSSVLDGWAGVIPWPASLGCLMLFLAVGWLWSWHHQEDFWQHPQVRASQRQVAQASMADVKQAVTGSPAPQPTPGRWERFRRRQHLRRRCDHPIYLYDATSQRVTWREVWSPETGKRLLRALPALLLLLPFAIGMVMLALELLAQAIRYFLEQTGWSLTVREYVLTRAVVSWIGLGWLALGAVTALGAEVVVRDRRRRVLTHFLLTRLSGRSIFRAKLAVVLNRAATLLLGLMALGVGLVLWGGMHWPTLLFLLLALGVYCWTYGTAAILLSAAAPTPLTATFHAFALLLGPTLGLLLWQFAGGGPTLAGNVFSPFAALLWGSGLDRGTSVLGLSVGLHLLGALLLMAWGERHFAALLLGDE